MALHVCATHVSPLLWLPRVLLALLLVGVGEEDAAINVTAVAAPRGDNVDSIDDVNRAANNAKIVEEHCEDNKKTARAQRRGDGDEEKECQKVTAEGGLREGKGGRDEGLLGGADLSAREGRGEVKHKNEGVKGHTNERVGDLWETKELGHVAELGGKDFGAAEDANVAGSGVLGAELLRLLELVLDIVGIGGEGETNGEENGEMIDSHFAGADLFLFEVFVLVTLSLNP